MMATKIGMGAKKVSKTNNKENDVLTKENAELKAKIKELTKENAELKAKVK